MASEKQPQQVLLLPKFLYADTREVGIAISQQMLLAAKNSTQTKRHFGGRRISTYVCLGYTQLFALECLDL